MKKLLGLLIVGGLLCLTTGCPAPSTGPSKKGTTEPTKKVTDTKKTTIGGSDLKKEDPKKEDPKKEDPKKEDPKKEDPKKEDPKKEDPKKDPKK